MNARMNAAEYLNISPEAFAVETLNDPQLITDVVTDYASNHPVKFGRLIYALLAQNEMINRTAAAELVAFVDRAITSDAERQMEAESKKAEYLAAFYKMAPAEYRP